MLKLSELKEGDVISMDVDDLVPGEYMVQGHDDGLYIECEGKVVFLDDYVSWLDGHLLGITRI